MTDCLRGGRPPWRAGPAERFGRSRDMPFARWHVIGAYGSRGPIAPLAAFRSRSLAGLAACPGGGELGPAARAGFAGGAVAAAVAPFVEGAADAFVAGVRLGAH